MPAVDDPVELIVTKNLEGPACTRGPGLACSVTRDRTLYCFEPEVSHDHDRFSRPLADVTFRPVALVEGVAKTIAVASRVLVETQASVSYDVELVSHGDVAAVLIEDSERLRRLRESIELASGCRLDVSHRVFCPGNILPPSTQGYAPVREELALRGARTIAATGQTVCAVMPEGGVRCSGVNTEGEAGADTREHYTEWSTVEGLPDDLVELAALRPVTVDVPPLVELDAGGVQTCGRTADGEIYCWGSVVVGGLCS